MASMGHVKLKEWFLQARRVFPWRQEITPYRVWVSEVMLQQTRAKVVIDYFNAWMQTFPTLQSLANATEEAVIKQWEGLGYYSRARNLRLGAIEVMEKYNGVVPDDRASLLEIKGLGPYTAGAILSFAFQKRAPALDGNVIRVLSRYLAFEKDVIKGRRELEGLLLDFLPQEEPHIAMEALIELGALVCQKQPACNLCPLKDSCLAHLRDEVAKFPIKKNKREITPLFRFVACIFADGAYLLKKGEKGKVMEGLFEFPYLDTEQDPLPSQYIKEMETQLGLPLRVISPLPKQKHHFTRYQAHLYPFLLHADKRSPVQGYEWVTDLKKLPFSSGHKKIMGSLEGHSILA